MSRQKGRRRPLRGGDWVRAPLSLERVEQLLVWAQEVDCESCGHGHLVLPPITATGLWTTVVCASCDGCVLCEVCHPDASLDEACDRPSIT